VASTSADSSDLPRHPDEALAVLQGGLGVVFRDPDLLRTALTHPSYSNEHPAESPRTNERLEFLGDAVLGLIVAETLYAGFPDLEEGRLTEWRAQIVCGPTLAKVAQRYRLGESLLLGRGEEATGGRTREGNLERVFEAVVGAVMLDGGLETAREFARRALAPEFQALEDDPATLNPKGALQQLVQGAYGRPHYVTASEEGPEHARRFTIEVRIDGEVVGTGSGPSKQQAEKEAARQAIEVMRQRLDAAQRAVG
jgi:ribonuclease-3